MLRMIVVLITTVIITSTIHTQEVIWQQEYQADINGVPTCAYSGGFHYAKPVLVDIDADGDLDLFVGESDSDLNFIRNDGDSSSPQWTMASPNCFSLSGVFFAPSFCDIDADGDFDAFVGGWNGKIRFLQNDGDSHSPLWNLVSDEFNEIDVGGHATPFFCDIDADEDFDMFVGNSDGRIHFFRNDGNYQSHSFALADTNYIQDLPEYMCVPVFYDLDHDSDFDLFIGINYSLYFYRNDGDSSHAVLSLASTEYGNIIIDQNPAPSFGDLDGDGHDDLLVGESFLGIRFYRNTGNTDSASWELETKYYVTIDVGYPGFPAFTDIDGDGDVDMFMGNYHHGIFSFLNDGIVGHTAWSFSEQEYLSTGNLPTFCDINGDGDFDLFCGMNDGTMVYYQNDGTVDSADWSEPQRNYNSIDVDGKCSPVFCDIDGDNDFDLFVGKESGRLNFYENIGDGTTPDWAEADTSYADIYVGQWRSRPAFSDIDQDEDFDLFIGKYDGTISFYRNHGDLMSPLFILEADRYAGIQIHNEVKPVFADIDGDGDEDLFVGDDNGGLQFWRNMGFETDQCLRGDVNCDSSITPGDALCAFWRSILGSFQEECACDCSEEAAEVNCDGTITPGDALCIFWRSVLGDWTEECQCPPAKIVTQHPSVGNVVIGSAEGTAGEIVKVTIGVENPHGLDAFAARLMYPPDLLELKTVITSETTKDWISLNGVVADPGVATIGGFHTEGISAKGTVTIAEIIFEVLESPSGTGELILVRLTDDLTGAEVKTGSFHLKNVPLSYTLAQNYPNPFNPVTSIAFGTPEDTKVMLNVFNILGQKVAELVNEELPAGYHKVIWDSKNVASGIYFYRIEADNFAMTKRMVVTK